MKTKRPPGRPRAEVKPHQFSVRLHDSDLAALNAMAALYGTSLSGAVEACVRKTWATISPSQKRMLAGLERIRNEAS